MRTTQMLACCCFMLVLQGCSSSSTESAARIDPVPSPSFPQVKFLNSLRNYCGQAFEGKVVTDTTGNPDFARLPLTMHVRTCESGRIMIPFHVADDRSRTWIFTTTPEGLRLKHDHRHEDGSEDEITQYGGDTRDEGTASRQRFYADEHTAGLIPEASTNIWTVEIIRGRLFAYELERVGTDRRFRVEFDLTRPVPPPPAPWGH